MGTPPAVSLVKRILEEHHLDRDQPRLLPCIHHDLRSDLEFLAAAAHRYSGVLFDLSSPGDWQDPPGPINVQRRELIAGLASRLSGALPAPLEFTERSGRVVTSLSGSTRPPEASLIAILRGASVILSAAINEFDLLLLCADTDTSDPLRAEFLWQMVTLDPRDLGLDRRQTLVAIMGSAVDPESDYSRRPDVSVVVRPDRLLRRPPRQTEQAVRTIAKFTNPLVLFLGAGASATSGIALGNTYRDQALRDILGADDAVPVQHLENQFFDWCHDRDRFLPGESDDRELFCRTLTLERVLRETFQELGPQPRLNSTTIKEISADCAAALGWLRTGRKAIRELIDRLRGRLVVITVNFDQLIEHDLLVPHRVFATPDAFRDHIDDLQSYLAGDDGKPVPILKLHGTIDEPDSLIATVDSTAAGFNEDVRTALRSIIDACDAPLTWVWIGCSMRDRDVSDWLRGLGQDVLDEWWVDPFPSESLDTYVNELRRSHWSQAGRQLADRLVIDSADRFLDQLNKHLASGV